MCGFSWVFCLTHPWHIDTSNGIKWLTDLWEMMRLSWGYTRRVDLKDRTKPMPAESQTMRFWNVPYENGSLATLFEFVQMVCFEEFRSSETLIPVHFHDRLWHSDKVKWWNHQHQSFWLTRSWQALVGITLICAWTLPKLTELLRFERKYKLIPHCECNRHEKIRMLKSIWFRCGFLIDRIRFGFQRHCHHSLANGSTCSLVWCLLI